MCNMSIIYSGQCICKVEVVKIIKILFLFSLSPTRYSVVATNLKFRSPIKLYIFLTKINLSVREPWEKVDLAVHISTILRPLKRKQVKNTNNTEGMLYLLE